MSSLELITQRRSVLAKNMTEPGPNDEQVTQLLRAAHRVPDHGKIGPWRFLVFKGDARADFGREARKIYAQNIPDASDKLLAFQDQLFLRAPLVIGVIASPDVEHKVPVWEQSLSAGAACQNILLAASSLGFAAQWLTEWYSYDKSIHKLLALKEHEQVAGFIYIGTAAAKPEERVRPSLEERTKMWSYP